MEEQEEILNIKMENGIFKFLLLLICRKMSLVGLMLRMIIVIYSIQEKI